MTQKSRSLEKIFFWILLSALLIGFFYLLSPFFSALLFALVLSLTCEPLYESCLRLTKKRRHPAAALSIIILLFVFAVPLGFLATALTSQLIHLTENVVWDPNFFENVFGSGWLAQTIDHWKTVLEIDVNLGEWLKNLLKESAHTLYQFSPKVVSKTAGFFFNAILTLFLTYVILVEGPRFLKALLEFAPLKEKDEALLIGEIQKTLKACVNGYLLTALAQGLLAGIAFWFVGIDIFLLLGVATFVMSFVPVVGAASVWAPMVVYLFVMGQNWPAFGLLVYGVFIISGIDNILKPMLIQGKTKIHPVLLFLTIFGGLKIWGPIGLLAGPVLVAVLFATLKIYREDFR